MVGASSASSPDGSALNVASRVAAVACRQDVGGDLRKPFAPRSASESVCLTRRRRRGAGKLREERSALKAASQSARVASFASPVRSNFAKECATHFDFDFWYTALWKVCGGCLPDQAHNRLCIRLPIRGKRIG